MPAGGTPDGADILFVPAGRADVNCRRRRLMCRPADKCSAAFVFGICLCVESTWPGRSYYDGPHHNSIPSYEAPASSFDSQPEPLISSDSGAKLALAVDFFAKGRNHCDYRLLHHGQGNHLDFLPR